MVEPTGGTGAVKVVNCSVIEVPLFAVTSNFAELASAVNTKNMSFTTSVAAGIGAVEASTLNGCKTAFCRPSNDDEPKTPKFAALAPPCGVMVLPFHRMSGVPPVGDALLAATDV